MALTASLSGSGCLGWGSVTDAGLGPRLLNSRLLLDWGPTLVSPWLLSSLRLSRDWHVVGDPSTSVVAELSCLCPSSLLHSAPSTKTH